MSAVREAPGGGRVAVAHGRSEAGFEQFLSAVGVSVSATLMSVLRSGCRVGRRAAAQELLERRFAAFRSGLVVPFFGREAGRFLLDAETDDIRFFREVSEAPSRRPRSALGLVLSGTAESEVRGG